MSFAIWQRTIVDSAGNVIPGAIITVRRESAGSPLADLKADREGAISGGLANPFEADGEGFAQFYVVGGAYKITAQDPNDLTLIGTWRYVAIGTAAETDALEIPTPTPAQWTYQTPVTDSDPGSMNFQLNNADPTLATAAYIDNSQFTSDGAGVTATSWLDLFDDAGDAASRGVLEIFDASFPTETFHRYRVSGSVVDGGGYRKLTLTWLSGQGLLSADSEYEFAFWPAGPTGVSVGALFGSGQYLGLSSTVTNLSAALDSGKLVLNFNADRIVNLPLPTTAGTAYSFVTVNGGAGGNLTINTIGSETIILPNGQSVASIQLKTGTTPLPNSETLTIVSDGTNWEVVAGNARAATTSVLFGRQTISIPAAAMYTPSTAGAAAATTELVASAPINALRTLAFDPGTEQAAFCMIPMPKSADLSSGIVAEFLWTATSGAGSVVWGIEARMFSESDALEQAFGTQQTVTDALTTAGDLHVSAQTSTITPAGSAADDSVLFLHITREAANAADTLNVNALLLGIRLFYNINEPNDNP